MKAFKIIKFILFAVSSTALAQTPINSPSPVLSTPSSTETRATSETKSASTAERRVTSAKLLTQKHPERFQNYNELAMALVARARETCDAAYYHDAEQAIQSALQLSPNEFQVLKTQVVVLLGQHKYAQAREKAQALNQRTPDDVAVYGYLASADLQLGDYDEAEIATQWMLNLRPNNIPGLLVGADFREVTGDPEGALQFLSQAYNETSPDETEELEWIANRIASVQIKSGQIDAAEHVLEQAQKLVADYPYFLENLASVRLAQNKFAEATELLRKRAKQPGSPRTSYVLARALDRAGKADEAKAAYTDFERAAADRADAIDNANRELILYYVDVSRNAPKALDLARREIGLRHDVLTLDAYAWALYANARYEEARREIEKAIAVGVRDPQIFFHAGKIAAKLNAPEVAAHYFEESETADSRSEFSSQAHTALKALSANNSRTQELPAGPAVSPSPERPPGSAPSALPPETKPADAAAAEHPVAIDQPATPQTQFQAVPAALLVPRATETDRAIRSRQAQVVKNPGEPAAYALLGAAFFQKARETGDVANFELAEKALSKSLELNSADMSAAPATLSMAEVCMGEHRFADALAYAQKSLSFGSGDLTPFAVEGDAYTDMGEYEKGATAYSRLQVADNGVKSTASYVGTSRLAYLRFISGDTEGAVRLMQAAVSAGSNAQLPSENLAWLHFELGEYYFQAGNAAAADDSYFTALSIHPGDYRALAGLARVRANEGKYAEAIELYRRAVAVVPMPNFIAELGDIYQKTGQTQEATKQFHLVEYIGLLGNINQVLHNRDLAIFYADHDTNLVRSLELARKEFEVRHDIYTWDALGWALYKNGNYQEAAEAMTKALRFHTRDATLLFHAGMIHHALGQNSQSREYLTQALAINPKFHVIHSAVAQHQLERLDRESSAASNAGTDHAQ